MTAQSVVLRDFESADQERVRDLILGGLGEHWGHIDPSLNPDLLRVSVAPPARKRGVGRQVVDALLRTARQWEVDRVVLETTADWTEVVAFWLRCGFVLTHHQEGPFGQGAWFEYRL